MRCADCKSAYLDPRPTEDTLHLAYRDYYTHKGKTAPVDRGGWRRLRNKIANGYRNRRFGTSHKNAISAGAFPVMALPSLRFQIDQEFRFLPHPSRTQSARLLDVGCGDGSFLALAGAAGWRTFGCDPDPQALIAASKSGAELRQGGVEVWLDGDNDFDAITVSHVLEHVHRPIEFLSQLRILLKPDGYLYVEVPNIEAVGHAVYGRHWLHLDPPRHLALPTLHQLIQSLKGAGFVEIKAHTRFTLNRTQYGSAQLEAGLPPFGAANSPGLRLPHPDQCALSRQSPEKAEYLTISCTVPS